MFGYSLPMRHVKTKHPKMMHFLRAMEYLNVKSQVPRSGSDTDEHFRDMLSFLGEDPEELHQSAVLLLGVVLL